MPSYHDPMHEHDTHYTESLPVPLGNKTDQVKRALGHVFPGMLEAIGNGACPVCKKEVRQEQFRDALSITEYGISGLCQECQDAVFGPPEAA